MDDLIKRQDAIDAVQKHFSDFGFVGYQDGQKMMDRIKDLPSAEKTGKWIEKNRVYSEESHIEDWQSCCCSVCGHYDTRPYMYYFDEPNYCSYCGARMGCEEE